MDLRLALMCGTDIPIPECQLEIHQPKIKEIALIGENDFFSGVQCLCINKTMFNKDESLLENTNNFQIFMTIMSEKEAAEKKFAVQQVLTLLLPNKKVTFTPRSLIVLGDNGSIMIDESNFEALQAAVSSICCLKTGPMDQQTFNPANAQAKAIADKLMRGRQRVAAQKGETNTSIFSQYVSILTVGLHSMSLQEAMDLTMFQLYDLVERYMLYLNWDMDIRSRLAGGKPESQPDNWMKNIH
jgi:hypothetical protein